MDKEKLCYRKNNTLALYRNEKMRITDCTDKERCDVFDELQRSESENEDLQAENKELRASLEQIIRTCKDSANVLIIAERALGAEQALKSREAVK